MKYLKSSFIALFISLPFAFWGWAYELSYFNVLKLNVSDTFNYIHYVLSGGFWVILFLCTLLLMTAIEKFFSKNIEKNDWDAVKNSLSKTQFSDVIGHARVGFFLSISYLLIVTFVPSGFWFISDLGSLYLIIVFYVILLFFAGLWLSPNHSKFSVIIIFIISIGACLAAGGMTHARANLKLEKIVRDDYLVTITKTKDGKFIATAKTLQLPLPSMIKKYL